MEQRAHDMSTRKRAERTISQHNELTQPSPKRVRVKSGNGHEIYESQNVAARIVRPPGDPVAGTFSQPSQLLCSRCREIDFNPLFDPRVVIPDDGYLVSNLGRPGSDHFKPGCSLCEALLSITSPQHSAIPHKLRVFEKAMRVGTIFRSVVDHTIQTCSKDRYLAVNPNLSAYSTAPTWIKNYNGYKFSDSIIETFSATGFLVPITATCDHSCGSHQIDPDAIPYDVIKSWLHECLTNHGGLCKEGYKSTLEIPLSVIDCWDDCKIVSPKPTDPYVALSYVWGKQNNQVPHEASVKDSETRHSKIKSLTVLDAIKVVKNIGYRYLWVDQLCISQLDPVERHRAIANMDAIYSCADLTIVALYGESSMAGLPGVSSVRRQHSPAVSVGHDFIASTLPSLRYLIEMSAWGSRGWTFQEGRLSSRSLFFSKSQVYFSCHESILSETLPISMPKSSLQINLYSKPEWDEYSTLPTSPENRFTELKFFHDRKLYSQRNLTYQSDAIDAFKGIINIHPFITYWGIPVARIGQDLDPKVVFALGLCWYAMAENLERYSKPEYYDYPHGWSTMVWTSRRRAGFPTWSWASLITEIHQERPDNEQPKDANLLEAYSIQSPQDISPHLSFKLTSSGMSLSEAVENCGTKALPETSKSIWVEGDVVRVKHEEVFGYNKDIDRYDFLGVNDEPIDDEFIEIGILGNFDVEDTYNAHSKRREPFDALVLLEWNKKQGDIERWFLLALKWIEPGVAERSGRLHAYTEELGVRYAHPPRTRTRREDTLTNKVPRKRMQFELR